MALAEGAATGPDRASIEPGTIPAEAPDLPANARFQQERAAALESHRPADRILGLSGVSRSTRPDGRRTDSCLPCGPA